MHTHVDFFKNTDVEVHFRPWISRNLIRNYRFQKLSRKFGKKSFVVNKNNNLIVPAHLFNVVHVLHHIYWYFLVEGVGLRQVLDLYFLSINNRNSDIIVIIKRLSMFKFTSAVRLSKHYPIEVFWTPIGIIYISIRGRFISWLAKVV